MKTRRLLLNLVASVLAAAVCAQAGNALAQANPAVVPGAVAPRDVTDPDQKLPAPRATAREGKGDAGSAPPSAKRSPFDRAPPPHIKLEGTGIAVPGCFGDSRDGQDCKRK